MYFLGQASNFRFTAIVRQLFAFGTAKDAQNLRQHLAKRYHTTPDRVALMYNGRSAITAALKATLPPHSTVIINGFTCYAVVQAVKAANCTPVYADIDRTTLSFTVKTLTQTLAAHPDAKAIILQNTLGIPMDIVKIEKFAHQHQLLILEDLAHCVGVKYADGREIGSVGSACMLSFGKGKLLDASTGGALVLRDTAYQPPRPPRAKPRFSDSLRARWYPLFGAIGRGLTHLHLSKFWYGPLIKLHFIKRAVDEPLNLKYRTTYWQDRLVLKQLQRIPTSGNHTNRTPLFVNRRAELLEKLAAKGYHFKEVWYDVPVSPIRYYDKLNFPETACPVATQVAKEIINLPTYYPKSQLQPALKIIQPYLIGAKQ